MPSTAKLLRHERVSIDRRSATEVAFSVLWQEIVTGRLAPGTRVTEEELAQRLSLSRTPLRDAIRRLEAIGLLTRQLNRSLRVSALSIEEMEDISLARERLEGLIAFLVTERYRTGDIGLERLEALHERMHKLARLGDMNLVLETGLEFHRELRALSASQHSARMLEDLILSLERYRYLVGDMPERAAEIAREHGRVIALIRAGDAAEADQAMREHVATARRLYRERLEALQL